MNVDAQNVMQVAGLLFMSSVQYKSCVKGFFELCSHHHEK